MDENQQLKKALFHIGDYINSLPPKAEWTADGFLHSIGPGMPQLLTKNPDPMFKKEELDKAIPGGKYKARLFDLGKQVDLLEYCKIREMVLQKQVKITNLDYQKGEFGRAPMVWVEWIRLFIRIPGK